MNFMQFFFLKIELFIIKIILGYNIKFNQNNFKINKYLTVRKCFIFIFLIKYNLKIIKIKILVFMVHYKFSW